VTKVLYIEHDDDNLYMLKTRLERVADFEVLAAEDSEEGCRLAVTEHPDVILLDLEMPVIDRWEPFVFAPIFLRFALHCCGGGMQLTLASNVSKLFRPLEKPPLAALPFFLGC
jgi:hypothetical protein